MTSPEPVITRRQQLIADHDKLQQMVVALATYNKSLRPRYDKPDFGPAEMLTYLKQQINELTEAEARIAAWSQKLP